MNIIKEKIIYGNENIKKDDFLFLKNLRHMRKKGRLRATPACWLCQLRFWLMVVNVQ